MVYRGGTHAYFVETIAVNVAFADAVRTLAHIALRRFIFFPVFSRTAGVCVE